MRRESTRGSKVKSSAGKTRRLRFDGTTTTLRSAFRAALATLIALCLVLPPFGTTASVEAHADETDAASTVEVDGYTRVYVPIHANLTSKTGFSGFYKDNVFYVSLDDLCALSGFCVASQGGNEVTLETPSGLRRIDVEVGSGNIEERLFSDSCHITCPSALIDGEAYVSALHFLNYLGATIDVNPDARTLTVLKRYDVLDALGDMKTMDNGHFFWWDELALSEDELEDWLVNAGVVALINQDPNFLRMMFDASGMEQDAIEDVLVTIVSNEGTPYFDGTASKAADELRFALNSASFLADAGSFIEGAYAESLVTQTDSFSAFGAASTTFSIGSDVLDALESVNEFDNMTSAQRSLLSETILAHPEDSDTICNGWEKLHRAAAQVDSDMQGAYSNGYTAAALALLDNANAIYDVGAKAGTLLDGNPVEIAWNTAVGIYQLLPSSAEIIDRKTHLYNAYNASIVQLVADELLDAAWTDIDRANFSYTDIGTEHAALQRVRSALVLRIKATLTARQELIESGFLDQALADQMSSQNAQLVSLLRSAEGSLINGCNMFSSEYDDDLSWMESCTNYAAAYVAGLIETQGIASADFETTYQSGPATGELTKYSAIPQGGSTAQIAAPDDESLMGIVYASLGDFDGNGHVDAMVGEMRGSFTEHTFAGQHDLEIVFTPYFFGEGPEPEMGGSLVTSLSPGGNDALFAFVDGSRFVLARKTDDLGRTFEFTPEDSQHDPARTYYYDDEVTVYDLSGGIDPQGDISTSWLRAETPVYHKDLRRSEGGPESVHYSLDILNSDEGSRTFYYHGFNSPDPMEFSSEDEACAEINAGLAQLVSAPLGQLSPVGYDERDATGFIPTDLDGLGSCVLLSAESSAKSWTSDSTAQGTVHVTGTYLGL